MTEKLEEIIVEQLFKLSDKVDKIQEKMVTKEELKEELSKLTTKEELKEEVSKLATKEEVSKLVTKKELKEAMDKQAEEIAEVFHDTFRTTTKLINQRIG